jgi:hypothetical protein
VYALSIYVELSRFYELIAIFFLYAGIFIAFAVLFRAISVMEIKDMLKMLRQKNLLHRPHH